MQNSVYSKLSDYPGVLFTNTKNFFFEKHI